MNKRDIYIFSFIFSMAFIYILPIIMSNRYYIDDLGRSLYGYSGWKQDGRPFANIVMHFLNFGQPILDISPMTQLLSILVLSFSLTLYAKKNFREGSPVSVSVGLFLFIGNPFFIQNLSYKYDSITMSLSLVFILLCFVWDISGIYKNLICVFLILLSLCSYQAAIGLFFTLCSIGIIIKLDENKNNYTDILKYFSKRFLQFIVAYAFYVELILKHTLVSSGVPRSKMISFDMNSVHIFLGNVEVFLLEIQSVVTTLPFIITALYMFSIFICAIKFGMNNKFNVGRFFIFLTLVISSLLFSFVHLCFFWDPVYAPRVLLSFSGFMIFLYFCFYRVYKNFSTYLLIPLVYLCFFYSYSYGTASSAQNRIDTFTVASLSFDISHHNKKFKIVSVIGSMPESQQKKLIVKRLPIMNDMILVYENSSSWLVGQFLKHFLGESEFVYADKSDYSFIKNNKPFVESDIYNIYDNKEKMIISFKNK